MKNVLLTMIFLFVVLALGAQEQRGFVKPSQKGQALSGVTVHVKGGFADWSETGSSSLFAKNKDFQGKS